MTKVGALFVLCAALTFLAPGAAKAQPGEIYFMFTSTVDATDFGLSANEPIQIHFSYDPAAVDAFELYSGGVLRRVIYRPATGAAFIGGDALIFTAQVSIDNRTDNFGDIVAINAATFLSGTSLNGWIGGTRVRSFELSFNDQDATC